LKFVHWVVQETRKVEEYGLRGNGKGFEKDTPYVQGRRISNMQHYDAGKRKKWGEELSRSKWFSWKGKAAYRKALPRKGKADV